MPAAQGHVTAAIPAFTLFTGVVTVTRVAHPQGVGRAHVVRVDDQQEVVTRAFERCQRPRREEEQDVDQEVMWEERQVRHHPSAARVQ